LADPHDLAIVGQQEQQQQRRRHKQCRDDVDRQGHGEQGAPDQDDRRANRVEAIATP